ncbi:hypothetical protein ACRS3X_17585 [Ectopseudomonas hydrolytica]|uniref:hypothetical protein n=1 Tax=Ectopseudomonas hydrolytica TaxID=2493633 RepID=UPI0010FC07FA|nr:hypothetical protein PSMEN_07165 [Pseudomonas mendocina]
MRKLVALHKHWCAADALKQVILAPLPEEAIQMHGRRISEPAASVGEMHSQFLRLQVWYALIYVVIEGYRELKAADPEIDLLLKNEDLVNALRLFRNAMFHYQADPVSEKLMGFLEAESGQQWIRSLNREFKNFFEKSLPIEETMSLYTEPSPRRKPWWRFWGAA